MCVAGQIVAGLCLRPRRLVRLSLLLRTRRPSLGALVQVFDVRRDDALPFFRPRPSIIKVDVDGSEARVCCTAPAICFSAPRRWSLPRCIPASRAATAAPWARSTRSRRPDGSGSSWRARRPRSTTRVGPRAANRCPASWDGASDRETTAGGTAGATSQPALLVEPSKWTPWALPLGGVRFWLRFNG